MIIQTPFTTTKRVMSEVTVTMDLNVLMIRAYVLENVELVSYEIVLRHVRPHSVEMDISMQTDLIIRHEPTMMRHVTHEASVMMELNVLVTIVSVVAESTNVAHVLLQAVVLPVKR